MSKEQVERNEQIADESYHHGFLLAEDAERQLRKDGDFLVRSEKPWGSRPRHVLSALWEDKCYHIPIHLTSKESCYVSKGKYELESIPQMIEFFRSRDVAISGVCPVRLRRAMKRADWELLNDNVKTVSRLGASRKDFGAVYKAKLSISPSESVTVVAKALDLRQLDRTERKQRYEQLLARAMLVRPLRHPNLVKLIGVAIKHLPFYIVYEYMTRGQMDVFIQKNGRKMEALDRLTFALHGARGLDYLHTKGLVHCDVAARNFLLDKEHNVKLGSFGRLQQILAVPFKEQVLAPVRWSAPEAFDSRATTKSDVYSFGVVLWEIFSNGSMPWEGDSAENVVMNVKTGKRLEPPSNMPRKVRELLAECCEQNPDSRLVMAQVSSTLVDIIKDQIVKGNPGLIPINKVKEAAANEPMGDMMD